jgi:hypothetical protein
MLLMKTNCENCGQPLAQTSEEAMICSYECTYCKKCAFEILAGKCPNCGGSFEKRPVRQEKIGDSVPINVL